MGITKREAPIKFGISPFVFPINVSLIVFLPPVTDHQPTLSRQRFALIVLPQIPDQQSRIGKIHGKEW